MATATTPLMDSEFKDNFGPDFKDKTPLMDGWSPLPTFLLVTFFVFPLWLFVVVPVLIIYQACLKVASLCSKPKRGKDPFQGIETAPASEAEIPDKKSRDYDFILMGATGFTGKLAAEYIISTYGTGKYKWAVAGRSRGKLEKLVKHLKSINAEAGEVPLVIANSLDTNQMDELAKKTRAVLSTVGPFAKFGSPLVASCCRFGTHYCDITGEVGWVRHVIEKLDKTARRTGARIVPLCGHDSVPWDMVTMIAAREFERKGDSLADIRIFDDVKGAASGGTFATLFNSFQNPMKTTKSGFDPMVSDEKGNKSANKLKINLPGCCSYNSEIKKFVGPFVMAPVNANVVRRSNALLGYSPVFTYYEVMTFPGCMAAWLAQTVNLFIGTAIFLPPCKAFMYAFFLPKPGQGPSRESMKEGYLKVSAIARSMKGSKLLVRIGFSVDPGYEDTARILVESGLCTLQDEIEKEGKCGLLTPASAFGSKLLDRLRENGRGIHLSFSYLSS
ncbi:hypothetical protein AAMO2058_000870400 [Amorphochlora amoebiformis]